MNTHNQLIRKIQELINEHSYKEVGILITSSIEQSEGIEQADLYYQLARLSYHLKEYDKGVQASTKAIEQLREHDLNNSLGDFYMVRGHNYHMQKNFKPALNNYKQALEIAKNRSEPDSKELDGYTYAVANILYHYLGEYEEALNYYSLARDIAKQQGNSTRQAFFETHIGMAHTELGNYKLALIHSQLSLDLLKDPDDPIYMFTILEMVRVRLRMGHYVTSMEQLMPVLERALNHEDPFAFASTRFFITEALHAATLPHEIMDYLRVHLPEDVSPESILDYIIPILEEKGHKRHIVEALVLKTNISGPDEVLLQKARNLARAEQEVPLLRMVGLTSN